MSAAAEHLVGQVIAAHGGLDRWSQVQTLTVRFSAGGLLFRLKGRTHGLENATVRFVRGHQLGTAASAGPRPWQLDIGAPDQLRRDIRRISRFPRPLRWSSHDLGTFTGAAMWTYLHLPFMLADADVPVELGRSWRGLRRLDFVVPAEHATHSHAQSIYVDDDGLIRRHDYVALVLGRWAHAVHRCDDYRSFDGIAFATRRVVTPSLFGAVLPHPQMVRIAVDDLVLGSADRVDTAPSHPLS
jgi:hypothetical protein